MRTLKKVYVKMCTQHKDMLASFKAIILGQCNESSILPQHRCIIPRADPAGDEFTDILVMLKCIINQPQNAPLTFHKTNH